MNLNFSFFLNSILLGVGLAMDAFSVSLANGLNEPLMKKRKQAGIAGIFSLFQFAMPMIGWICVSTVAKQFAAFEKCIPWIALILLGYIGGKMLYEGIKNRNCCDENPLLVSRRFLYRELPHRLMRYPLALPFPTMTGFTHYSPVCSSDSLHFSSALPVFPLAKRQAASWQEKQAFWVEQSLSSSVSKFS